MSQVLRIEDLDVHYGHGPGKTQVLHGAGLTVDAGEAVGLVGETGSGKTTLARAVLGLIHPSAGSIHLAGEPIHQLRGRKLRELRRRGDIGYVFQDPLRSLDPDRTLGDSVCEPLAISAAAGKSQGKSRGRAEQRRRAVELLETVDLGEWIMDRYPSEVSGGQRQRAAIARTLMTEPRLIILDEPVSALDAPNRATVLRILSRLRDTGAALLFISHDLGSVAGLTERTVVLYRGEIKEQGATSQIINNPQHPYTQLLVGSAPRMFGETLDRSERDALRGRI